MLKVYHIYVILIQILLESVYFNMGGFNIRLQNI